MLTYLKIIGITAFILLTSLSLSNAEIVLDGVSSNNKEGLFNQAEVNVPAGIPGDFEIITCTTAYETNTFFDPTPGSFSLLDSGGCGGVDSCELAFWTRLDDSAGASQIFCNWDLNTNVFAAGALRYSGVDINNPIIGVDCGTGVGLVATAPSIDTQKGSEVLRVVSLLRYNVAPGVAAQAEKLLFEVTSASGTQTIELFAVSSTFEESGPTGEEEFQLGTSADNWRACTIALRAVEHQIPTLSEWGLGIFAGLFGLSAVWALRRRAVRA
jgi:hypothetical protein